MKRLWRDWSFLLPRGFFVVGAETGSGAAGMSIVTPAKVSSKIRSGYTFTAIVFLNSVLLFLFLNLVLWVGMVVWHVIKPSPVAGPLGSYGKDAVFKAYPGWREEDVRTLLKESWGRGYSWFEYEPFTGFRERPFQGKFIHSDPAGFRLSKDQAPWPPRSDTINVFVFGGSTTYGYGLPDDQTIPSYLEKFAAASYAPARVAVYNFGRGSYFSTQELILFQQLLSTGFVPRVAVFIDGLNEFDHADGQPRFAGSFRRFMDGQAPISGQFDNVPMIAAARWVSQRWAKPQLRKSSDYADRALLQGVIDRWQANKRMIDLIAGGFGVRTIFVWQPVPVYNYDLRYHSFLHSDRNFGVYARSKYGYALMKELRAQGKLDANVLWLADLQQDKTENLYVDAVHYNAPFSREIAARICSFEREHRAEPR
jgi:hypothetical protein